MRYSRIWQLFSVIVLLFSCAKEDSENVKTSGIWANFDIVSEDGITAMATATFRVGGPTSNTCLSLTSGDSIEVNGEQMTKETVLNCPTYKKELTYGGGSTYTFEFKREGEDPQIQTMTLPQAFSIIAPNSGAELVKGASFDVKWTSPGVAPDDFILRLSKQFTTLIGSTEQSSISKHPNFNSDEHTFSSSETTDPDASGVIEGEVSIRRLHTEDVGSGFKGGSITGSQSRTVSFTLQ